MGCSGYFVLVCLMKFIRAGIGIALLDYSPDSLRKRQDGEEMHPTFLIRERKALQHPHILMLRSGKRSGFAAY